LKPVVFELIALDVTIIFYQIYFLVMDLSIQKVAMIVLAIMVVAAVVAGFTGWFNQVGQGFVDSVSYSSPGP